MKPGDLVIDPLGRRVLIFSIDKDIVTVKLFGPYGATIRYTYSMLRIS
jgi:hypothetical protein